MKTSVEVLRQNGYKVRVQHKRAFKGLTDVMTRGKFEEVKTSEAQDWAYQNWVSPKGGETVVQITTPTGENLEGVARCSKSDPYNRKKGLLIALGRALSGTSTRQAVLSNRANAD